MENSGRNIVLLTLTSIILVLSYILLLVTIDTPYIGLSVQDKGAGLWQISEVDDLGWAEQQGMKIGDTVSAINSIKPSNYWTVQKFGVIEQAETLVINRDGQSVLYRVPNYMTPQQVRYFILMPTLVLAIYLLSSFFLYLKKCDDKAAIHLIFLFLAIGLSYLSAGVSSRVNSLGIYINRVAFSAIPILFLKFIAEYFRQYNLYLYRRRLLISLYLLNGLLLLISPFSFLLGISFTVIRYSFLAVFSIGIFLCFYILILGYIRYRNTPHRPVFKLILAGFGVAFFPFVVLVSLPSLIFGVELIPGALAAAFLVFFPLVFLYLIVANHLFDIDFIIDRIRYYSLLSFIPTAFLIVYLMHFFVSNFNYIQWIQISLVAYLGVIGFLYLKEELDFYFRSKLFRERYNFQASLDRFSHDISTVMKTSDLDKRLIAEIQEVLGVRAISLCEINWQEYSISHTTGSPEFPETVILDWLMSAGDLIPVGELVNLKNNEVFFIVRKGQDECNVVWLKEKLNRTGFNQDERVWLKTMASYVSIVYENLHLVKGLMGKLEEAVAQKGSADPWMLRLLFNLSEKERRRLASDLHDSALQQLFLLYRSLETTASDQRIPRDLRKQLKAAAEGQLDAIHQIRETCNELMPPLLKEAGIVEALKTLFANAQLSNDYIVNFRVTGFGKELDYEYVLALYRIVQELLTNAAKHSKATKLDIALAFSEGLLNLNYRDNGIGMDLENLKYSLDHMGLAGIKERVLSLDGKTYFYSSLGKGFEVSIKLPLDVIASAGEKAFEGGGDEVDPYIIS